MMLVVTLDFTAINERILLMTLLSMEACPSLSLKKPEFNGHLSTVGSERVLIEDDISVVCIKITSASDMKEHLAVCVSGSP